MRNIGVIFDFNGTLFWDSELHMEAWREFSKQLRGTPFSDEEMLKYMFGRTNEDIITYAIGKRPEPDMVKKLAFEKEEVYRNMCRKRPDMFKLAPYAKEFLDYLKENNIPRTIATMSEKDNVDFYITEFNLAQWFDLDKIVYSDGTIPGKPAPDIYIIAANKLGLKPENCIVIEDAISGINSAKSAGIGKVVAIASMEKPEFYEPLGVDEIITDFKNYTEILKIKEMLF